MISARLVRCALLLGALLPGCSLLPPPRLESPVLYLLDAQPAAAATRQLARPLVLAVARPRAGPAFATVRMAYVRDAHRLDYFTRSRWVDTPAQMLAPLLAQALARAQIFRGVTQAPSAAAADLHLETELLRLQQDFTARPSQVQITLRARLVDAQRGRLVASIEFDEREPATSEDAQGGAAAANRALARVLEKLIEFCAAESTAR